MDPQEPINRVIRRGEVLHMSGFTDSALDREVRAGRFPAPFKLSPDPKARAVGWSLLQVLRWINERETAGRVEQDSSGVKAAHRRRVRGAS